MAEIATIARPYAEALFKVVHAQAAQAVEWLDALAVVAADPGLQQFAHDPKVSHRQVLELIAQVGPKSLPPAGLNFLTTLVENGRLSVLPEIAVQFHALWTLKVVSARRWCTVLSLSRARPLTN